MALDARLALTAVALGVIWWYFNKYLWQCVHCSFRFHRSSAINVRVEDVPSQDKGYHWDKLRNKVTIQKVVNHFTVFDCPKCTQKNMDTSGGLPPILEDVPDEKLLDVIACPACDNKEKQEGVPWVKIGLLTLATGPLVILYVLWLALQKETPCKQCRELKWILKN